VEEILTQAGDAVARLVQQVIDKLNAADFAGAGAAVGELNSMALTPPMRLFAACHRIRLAVYENRPLAVFDVLEEIEQPYAEMKAPGGLEKQWYVLSWLSLPFACGYPIDIFYLHDLAQSLPQLVMRQRCMARAVRYGVQFKDHPYMSFVLEHPAARMPEGGAPYYTALTGFLTRVYERRIGELREAFESLSRSATSPLEQYSTAQFAASYSHLWSG
jgi:hypothetical protein